MSGDPLIAGAYYGSDHSFTWFRSFLWVELYVPFELV